MENTLTQREFAGVVGISTATVSNMLKAGTLRKSSDGRIPADEVTRYFKQEIKKLPIKSYYLLSLGESEEGIKKIKSDFEENLSDEGITIPAYFDSIGDIITTARICKIDTDSKDKINNIQREYNIAVLDAFIKKYKAKAAECFSSFAFDEESLEIRNIPYSAIADIVLYGEIKNNYEDNKIQEYLGKASKIIDKINIRMNGVFEKIMRELELVNDNNSLLFTRKKLSPDFFLKKGTLYESFFYNFKNGERKEQSVLYIKRNDKIFNSIAFRSEGKTIKLNIRYLLQNGFYTLCNIDKNDNQQMREAAKAISSGFYSNIILCVSEEELNTNLSETLRDSIYFAIDDQISIVENLY